MQISADTLAALQCFTSSVWKSELWLLLTLSWWSCGLTVQWLNGPCCWWGNKWRGRGEGGEGEPKTVLPKSKMKKVPICVMACVRVCTVYVCVMQRDPELCQGSAKGSDHSVPRVGVLGWFRPMVLHNQPAKSTSSTSDRLMNVWLISIFRSALSAGFLIKHFVTKSWKSLVKTPSGSLGGGSFTM